MKAALLALLLVACARVEAPTAKGGDGSDPPGARPVICLYGGARPFCLGFK